MSAAARARRLALALGLLAACAKPAPVEDAAQVCPASVSDGQYRMGTVLEVHLCAPDRAQGEALLAELFAEVARLERIFSRFDVKSDLSKLNRAAGSGPLRVAPELVELTARSLELEQTTQGVFDVSVGPIVVLWSEAAQTGVAPGPEAVAAARTRVGPQVVGVDASAGTVALLVPGASLDFGGVAKGYALDRLAAMLRARGVSRALLSFGQSSITALGRPAGWDGWGVLLGDASGGFAGTAQLRDQSLSVSGSLGQYAQIGGRRYGHVIDPRSGAPLEHARVAMAIASDGTRAEAFSKALLILGERDGIVLLEQIPDAQGMLIDEDGRSWQTSGWTQAVDYSPEFPKGSRDAAD